jgi:hypothetical protein
MLAVAAGVLCQWLVNKRIVTGQPPYPIGQAAKQDELAGRFCRKKPLGGNELGLTASLDARRF